MLSFQSSLVNLYVTFYKLPSPNFIVTVCFNFDIFRMNDVETKYILEKDQLNATPFNNLSNSSGSNDTSGNSTTVLPTTLPPSSTELPNMTVIDTMVKTALAMQNITATYEPLNHEYYIYIWAIAILGCILLTTGR